MLLFSSEQNPNGQTLLDVLQLLKRMGKSTL
jgi:hypothetical protein